MLINRLFPTNHIFVIFILICLCNCSNYEREKEHRLNIAMKLAGNNQAELKKVLDYYKNDSLKLEAAKFLIRQLPYYYSYNDDMINKLKNIKADYYPGRVSDSILQCYKSVGYNQNIRMDDVQNITSDLMIKNIDTSFDIWNSCRWKQYYTFEDFCEYILPYRIKDEPLEEWKSLYRRKYKPVLDSLYQGSDVIEAARVISNYLKKEGFHRQDDWSLPHLGASYLFKYRLGTCRETCDISIYVMRSLGIPIAIDQYICSPSYNGRHFWTSIIDTTGRSVPFLYNEKEINRKTFDHRKKGKVFRTYFGAHKNIKYADDDKIYPLFRNPFIKDVSDQYFSNKVRVNVENDKEKYVYLSVFNNRDWRIVDMSTVCNNVAEFNNVENRLIYQPVFYKAGRIVPAGFPFLLENSVPIYFIPEKNKLESAELLRKYPVMYSLKRYLSNMVGVKIKVANRTDLKDTVTVYEVYEQPNSIYNSLILSGKGKHRYVIFQSDKKKRIELAELWCYSDTLGKNKYVPGIIYGIPELDDIHKKITNLVIDNNYLSYYLSSKIGETLVFDFKDSVPVKRIDFIPHNDDNFIHIGDMYELFFSNGIKGWISLGKKIADSPFLYYDNLPKNSLLLLRNRTRGKEEQVFFMKEGKQVFAYDL